MKVIYDKETDTLTILLREDKVAESDEVQEGVILDYDRSGRLVSLEILDASEQVMQPEATEFALAATTAEAPLVCEKPPRKYGR